MNEPLLISGPSGVGKSYLVKHLALNYQCKKIVPVTTREKRPNEIHGVDYYFLSDIEYQNLLDDGEMLTHNDFFGARYGFSKYSVKNIQTQGLTPVSEMYTPTLPQFLNNYPDSRKIFLMPMSEELLIQRMQIRGSTIESIDWRTREGRKEIQEFLTSYRDLYDHIYNVDTTNFNDIVKDIVGRFSIECHMVGEGNKRFYL